WHLALLACLVVLAREGGRAWLWFDIPVLVFASWDGPFGIFLLSVAAVSLCVRKTSSARTQLAAVVHGAILQLVTMVVSTSRAMGSTGASFTRFKVIFGGQIVLGSLIGTGGLVELTRVRWVSLATLLATIVGILFLAYAATRGPLELKLFIF